MTGGRAIGSYGTGFNTGIWNNGSTTSFDTVTSTGTGGTVARGVVNENSATVTLTNVTATGSGGSTNQDWGIDNYGASTMTIRDSFITGTPNSILNNGSTVYVANTRLSTPASGSLYCFGAYKLYLNGFSALNAFCQ
jgi:hypothetical protein